MRLVIMMTNARGIARLGIVHGKLLCFRLSRALIGFPYSRNSLEVFYFMAHQGMTDCNRRQVEYGGIPRVGHTIVHTFNVTGER